MLNLFKKLCIFVLLFSPLSLFSIDLKEDELGLIIHNVKQGSASTVLFPRYIHPDGTKESFIMVYDAGTTTVGGIGQNKDFIKDMTEEIINHFCEESPSINHFYLIASHGDADHISLFSLLLQSLKKFTTAKKKSINIHHKICLLGGCRNEYLFTERGEPKQSGEKCLAAIESFFDPTEIFFSAEHPEPPALHFGPEVTYDFLFWKFIETAMDANSSSLVLRLSYKKRALLFLGDADAQTEAALLASLYKKSFTSQTPLPDLRTTLVILSHHGALLHGCNGILIGLTEPKAVAISVGEGNTYGHPQEKILRQLADSSHLETSSQQTTFFTHKTSSAHNRQDPWMGDSTADADSFSTNKAIYATWPMGTLEFIVRPNGGVQLPCGTEVKAS